MTLGIIGEKLGMTQIFDDKGLVIPVTVLKVEPLVVAQIKTKETDGYDAVQLAYCAGKEKHLTKAEIGHLKKNEIGAYRHLKEFRVDNPSDYKVGQQITVEALNGVEKVDVSAKSIGKGFQGTVKRWNFEPGSIGAGTTPGRVIKGKKMAGNMGNENVTVAKLKVVQIDAENNLLLIKGSVPGPEGKFVTVKPSRVKWN